MPSQPAANPGQVRIGARGSKLSLAQAGHMQRRIAAALGADPSNPTDVERVAPLIVITTTGDRIQDRRLLEIGGKGLFTKEIEEALIEGRIDCAIHSMKDMPALLPDGLCIAAVPEREDPRDAFLSRGAEQLEDLPLGAKLGTASLRRQAQSLNRRPDLDVQMLRGNVDTRLAKLAAGEADATLLAAAGLDRLGMHAVGTAQDTAVLLPAASQGAIGIECRADDGTALALLRAIDHEPTHRAVAAERSFLAALGGDCRSPVAAHAHWRDDGMLQLDAEIFSEDGADHAAGHALVDHDDAAAALARRLLDDAPDSVRRLFAA